MWIRQSINLAQITHHKSPIFKSGKCHIGLGPYITISCIKDTFMFSRLILQAIYDICQPAEEEETRTVGLKVTPEMSPKDVVVQILENKTQLQI